HGSWVYVLPVHELLATGTCGLYCCEGLIVKSSARQHLSIRRRNTAHPAVRKALLSRSDDSMLSFVAAGCMSLAYPPTLVTLQRHLVIDTIAATRCSASGARTTDEEAEYVTSLSDGTCGVCHPPIGRGPSRRRRLPARTAGVS